MDHIAKTIGLPADEFRRRNLLHQGMTTATDQVIHDPIVIDQLLERALELTDYHAKLERFAGTQSDQHAEERYRAGRLSAWAQGLPAPANAISMRWGGWKRRLPAEYGCSCQAPSSAKAPTPILSQIAAEALGLEYDDVCVAQVDTSISPNSGPTVASRTAMIIGKIVQTRGTEIETDTD